MFINNTYKVRKTGNCVFQECLKRSKNCIPLVRTGLNYNLVFCLNLMYERYISFSVIRSLAALFALTEQYVKCKQ